MEWVKEHLPLASGVVGFVTTVSGMLVAIFRWNSKKLDEKVASAVSTTVNNAVSEIMEDFSAIRERVAALEAHFVDTKEDIQEIKGKLDTLGGHVLQLPQRLAEALRK